MFDGQNVFGDEGSFAGGWHLDDVVDRLPPSRAVAPVVIGIEHGGELRIQELTPFPVWGDKPGLADEFLDWLVGTIVPMMRGVLPIEDGPVNAAIGGSSMGGLGALYAHYRHPDVFGGAVCMSPAFPIGGRPLFEYFAAQPKPEISRVYIDCGTKESGGRMLPAARRMFRLLERKGYPEGQLMFREDRRGAHNERNWRRRSPLALRFMFRV
jgi:predicted alpha/beta superfamily hydrolase